MGKQYVVLGISIFAFISTSYAVGGEQKISKTQTKMVEKIYNATHFDTIVADGYFNLSIQSRTGAKALVKTNSYEKLPITVNVNHDILYITTAYSSKNPGMYLPNAPHPTVKVDVPDLKKLEVYGPVNVTSSGIPGKTLSLKSEGYGNIDLKQAKNLRMIQQKGNNVLHISGIQSPRLALYSEDFGTITLQGTVNRFYARLNHHAVLHARHLAAKHVSVQAKDEAQAHVYPVKSLRAFSDQSAEVYYYNPLGNITRFPIQSGNVLKITG